MAGCARVLQCAEAVPTLLQVFFSAVGQVSPLPGPHPQGVAPPGQASWGRTECSRRCSLGGAESLSLLPPVHRRGPDQPAGAAAPGEKRLAVPSPRVRGVCAQVSACCQTPGGASPPSPRQGSTDPFTAPAVPPAATALPPQRRPQDQPGTAQIPPAPDPEGPLPPRQSLPYY